MMIWASLSKKFRPLTMSFNFELSQMYQRVFQGNPSRADQEAVLADFAAKCYWNQVTSPKGVASEELWFREGKRAAFAELFGQLTFSPEDKAALEQAARLEAAQLSQ